MLTLRGVEEEALAAFCTTEEAPLTVVPVVALLLLGVSVEAAVAVDVTVALF